MEELAGVVVFSRLIVEDCVVLVRALPLMRALPLDEVAVVGETP